MPGGGKGISRAISTQVVEEILIADLEDYRQMALQLGASEVEITPAQWV